MMLHIYTIISKTNGILLAIKKKAIIYPFSILLCTSCILQKGQWINDQCRPKRPNFKLLKIPFEKTDKIVLKKIYISDSEDKSDGLGFYPDGRMVFNVSSGNNRLTQENVKNWDNSIYIGYWRVVGSDKIKIQYFVCGNSGVYLEKTGRINGDTIVFFENIYYPTKKIVREEKYILTEMNFE